MRPTFDCLQRWSSNEVQQDLASVEWYMSNNSTQLTPDCQFRSQVPNVNLSQSSVEATVPSQDRPCWQHSWYRQSKSNLHNKSWLWSQHHSGIDRHNRQSNQASDETSNVETWQLDSEGLNLGYLVLGKHHQRNTNVRTGERWWLDLTIDKRWQWNVLLAATAALSGQRAPKIR